MSTLRMLITALAVSVALVVQVSVLPAFGWTGILPDLVLLVVVAIGLARGPESAMLVGFLAGLLLDLAPPSDHLAGRWALALVLVGFVAGRFGQAYLGSAQARSTLLGLLATVAACSFVGTSVYALTGLVLGDQPVGVPDLLRVVGFGVALDLVLSPLVLTPLLFTLRRFEPEVARG